MEFVSAWLDRGVCNWEWFLKFPRAKLSQLVAPYSDHYPIDLQLEGNSRGNTRRRQPRFEAMWVSHLGCGELIKHSWHSIAPSGDNLNVLFNKIRICRRALGQWNRETFGHVGKAVKAARIKLENLQNEPVTGDTIDDIKQVSRVLNEVLEREETLWKQRSKISWLKEGDNNTTFFHSKANQRRKRNTIRGLLHENGRWVTNQVEMASVATSYFHNLFTSHGSDGIDDILGVIKQYVTSYMNERLL
ncbi:hypothetical protein CFOL_v3_05441 [Cephalotus follicularis]|uniref:Exo_endo_phos domain-containing protein n=1 Tax=Cephalotus follicularis TaxID=3775 RepID=A0A1Q3B1M2_CEPFO|nr:hypothetical protein CFOL_v3_05441 [Cephalotus follicularis]